ncbi:XRE family transcriptional regulator, partial [Enterococcus faecalis]
FFAAAREPYITVLVFLLLIGKIFVWIKQMGMK